VDTVCAAGFNVHKLYVLLAQLTYVLPVSDYYNKYRRFLKNIDQLVLITEKDCFLCEVRIDYYILGKSKLNFDASVTLLRLI
jgi:hypothetical protein